MASEINGSRSHVPDYYVDETGTSYRLVYDNLGSLCLIVRVSNGLTVGIMEHDEFGVKIKDTTGSVVPFGFAGGLFEPYSRLVHFGAREYSQFDGRWLSKDPILFGGGDTNLYGYVGTVGKPGIETNLYGYSFQDPINFVDPDGKFPWLVAGIVAGVMYATDLDTPGAAQDEMIGVPLAAGGTAAGGPACELAQSNRYLRIGMGRNGGDKVFRASGQFIEWLESKGVPGIKNGHIDFHNFGPL